MLGAPALNATFQILTRSVAGEHLIALISYRPLLARCWMSLAVWGEFSDPTSLDALLFIAIGIFGLLGHFLYVQAFQRATASTISMHLWATLAG